MKRLITIAIVTAALAVLLPSAAPTAPQPAAPAGATGIALSGAVDLAWQPVAGATSYTVYRGATAGTATTLVSPAGGVTGTSFIDSTAANGSTYFYVVRSVSSATESANSLVVQATPVPRACSTGNAIVLENCYPGNNPWNVRNPATIAAGGIEGYATAQSINRGESVGLKVNSTDSSTFRVEIYRTGYYGGAGARLFSVITGVQGIAQPSCSNDSTTGLIDCSNWRTSLTLQTTQSWPSGVYAIRLVRSDTGTDNQILLAVRDDSRKAQVVYGVGFATFQAYNNYGGKSLYDFNSNGNNTVSGTPRAVKVSYDRPFEQPRSGLRDWYTRTEIATVYWLEQQGYDTSYISNTDLETTPTLLTGVKTYVSPAHDEYVSAGMRSALASARDAGVGLFFSGGNEVYWKVRFENGPSGGTGRIQVSYKSTQSGGPDPSGTPTGTWRDVNGANQPENGLTGQMYIGDNDNVYFPLVVSAVEGADRVYRYTPLASQPAGGSTTLGSNLVGWEWDARVANGSEPAGVKTLATSPVTGELLQGTGTTYSPTGSAAVNITKYIAPSGALVFDTGTNHWNRGLAPNAAGVGEPDSRIQQVTTNVLADMGAQPQTPTAGIVLDGGPIARPDVPSNLHASTTGPDSASLTWDAVPGADGYTVYRSVAARSDGQPLGSLATASLVTGTSFSDIGLSSATTYYYIVVAVKTGVQSLPSTESSTTTSAGAGQPTRIDVGATSSYTSSAGQTFSADTFFSGGNVRSGTAPISGTNDQKLYQSERWGIFNYAIPVTNGTYDVRFHFAETYFGTLVAGPCVGKRIFGMDILDTPASPDLSGIDICAAVGTSAAYIVTVPNVTIGDGVLNVRSVNGGVDDPELTALEVIPRAITAPSVTSTLPASDETDDSVGSFPRATFSRAMDPATINGSTVTLTGPAGAVPATVSFDAPSRTATLTPATPLAFSTSYGMTLASTIKSADGAPLGTPYTWHFTTQASPPPDVSSTAPDDLAAGVSPTGSIRATFTRQLNPATVTTSSFTLRDSGGALVPASVSYDSTTRQATLRPSGSLALSGTFTARLGTAIATTDGVPLAGAYVWSFTVAAAAPAAPTLTAFTPVAASGPVSTTTTVTATFSRGIDSDTLTASSFTLTGTAGSVPGTVSYDDPTATATFTPAVPLTPSATYTAQLATTISAADGAPFAGASWGFTTVDGPQVTSMSPADGATFVDRSAVVKGTFSRSMASSSITTSTFQLFASDGTVVPATVAYDNATLTATLTPASQLLGGVTYTASLSGTIRSSDGTPIGSNTAWKFTTSTCPCSLFPVPLVPALQNIPTRDGRAGTGPWTYEFGVKFRVDEPMRLKTIRFWKSSSETGTHVANLWTTTGLLLASTPVTGETASGWQSATLASPPALQAGTTYIASVNANSFYNTTARGLATQVVSGPLRSAADIANGVYGSAAGLFPNGTFNSSNYFTDVTVVPDGDPGAPTVTATAPTSGQADVDANLPLTAKFSRPMNPSTITASTFNVRALGTSGGTDAGGAVDATVAYDDATNTAILDPSAPLAHGVTYTVNIDPSIRAQDGKPLGTGLSWTFTVSTPPPPIAVTVSPGNGATSVGLDLPVKLTYNRTVSASTLTSSTTQIVAPGGAVVPATITYDAFAFTESIQPTAKLAPNTTYTVRVTPGVGAPDGTFVLDPITQTFTTGTCPCTLMTGLIPKTVGNPVQDGRTGAGPWSYELGTKIVLDQPAALASIRFWKDARETGTHTARVWSATGTLLATLPVTGETAGGGWQQANFATPFALAANTVYIVSVNANAFFSTTRSGLAVPLASGIAHSAADVKNGVYGSAAGLFPTNFFSSTNYFVDVVIR
jgi:fibronectin type 3 domain-containing protein